MTRPLMSALTLAVLGAWPGLSAAATNRFSGSATLTPSEVAEGGRFSLQARLEEPGAALPGDAKQADPIRLRSPADSVPTARFRLVAAVRDKNAPEAAVCTAGIVFQNGFE